MDRRSEHADREPRPRRWRPKLLARASGRRVAVGLIAVAIVAGGALAWTTGLMSHTDSTPSMASSATRAAGSTARFAYLASEHTNFCTLDRATVAGYPDDHLMQGACCDPMDMAKYQHQVADLRRYASITEIPKDPYDIRAGQAKQLLADDSSITLTGPDKVTYDTAMQKTDDKGPCCCQCWRWYMTEGLDKFLITQRHMSAEQVADITDLTNGCGGPLGSTPNPTGMQPAPS